MYHHAITSLSWLSPKAEKVWSVRKLNSRWWKILQHGWNLANIGTWLGTKLRTIFRLAKNTWDLRQGM
mgnify:CR=1 FL=1